MSLKDLQCDTSPCEFSPDEDDYKVVEENSKKLSQQYFPLEYSNLEAKDVEAKDVEAKRTEKNSGYVELATFRKSSKINDHRSYHHKISGGEATQLLEPAPETGYITRYSESKQKYFLTVFCPSVMNVQHFELVIDEGFPSYALKGTRKSFRGINELLDHYENNPVSSEYGEIGISYSRMNTRQWKLEQNEKIRKHEEESRKRNVEEASIKQNTPIEQTVSQSEMMELQKTLLDQQAETVRKILVEPLAQQQKEYQEQIVQLQKANQELMECLTKEKGRRRKKCSIQ